MHSLKSHIHIYAVSRVFERFATMPAWLLPKILDECNAWVAAGFRRIAAWLLLGRKMV
jgi:hypothetical protein